MPERDPSPQTRRTAWTATRIALAVGILVVLFTMAVIVFRGCHNGAVEPHLIDPDTPPLPGTEEVAAPPPDQVSPGAASD